jgi:hypothetical protein
MNCRGTKTGLLLSALPWTNGRLPHALQPRASWVPEDGTSVEFGAIRAGDVENNDSEKIFTDLLGLLLLLPPSRDLFRALGERIARSRIGAKPNLGAWGFAGSGARRRGRRPGDIDGTAEEIRDEPRLDSGSGASRGGS